MIEAEDGAPARRILAAQLTLDQAHLVVKPWPYMPEQVTPGRPVVSVYRERMNRNGTVLEHHLKLDVLVSLTDGQDAEVEAEDALDDVLLSLQRIPGCTWTEVQRVTFQDVFTGYTISAVMHSADIYKQAIAAENRPLPITEK